MDLRLKDRTIAITGGAGGIGEALCWALSREGARIGIIDVNEGAAAALATRIEADGGSAMALTSDCSDLDKMTAQASELRDRWSSPIYGLATCAGIVERDRDPESGVGGMAHAGFPGLLRHQLDLHLMGPAIASAAVVPQMLEAGEGVIAHISSVVSRCGGQNLGAYGISKAAILGLVRQLTASYGSVVRSVAFCPGRVSTPNMAQRMATDPSFAADANTTQVGELIQPENLAAQMAFALSPLSAGTEGAIHDVTGGNWALFGRVDHYGEESN